MMAQNLAETVLDLARTTIVMIAKAESCTGGMVAAALTDIAGSSAVVDRGFVTYSNAAKADMLGVAMDIINQHGPSAKKWCAMAAGAANSIDHDGGKLAVSISGIADPAAELKARGLVWFAVPAGSATGSASRQNRWFLKAIAKMSGQRRHSTRSPCWTSLSEI